MRNLNQEAYSRPRVTSGSYRSTSFTQPEVSLLTALAASRAEQYEAMHLTGYRNGEDLEITIDGKCIQE
ncbi:hypothetical protein LLF88_06245 [bacterium]|nr:hypothetical protein [bacterium]